MSRFVTTASIAGLIFGFFVGSAPLDASSLTSATVTETHNEVQLNKDGGQARPAVVKDVVAGSDVLRTGKKSRAEVLFNDDTIARLGASSVFSFLPGTDEMKMDRGSALIHVPPGQSGAKIKSPAATVAVLGDVVAMRVDERGVTQVIALSEDARGPVTVTSNKTGEKRELKAGEMLVIDPMAMTMPENSVISVEVFAQSSGLVNGFGKPLPKSANGEIHKSEEAQAKEIKDGNLEGSQIEAQLNTQNLPSTDPTSVQASVGSGFAGRYTGISKDLPPGTFVGNMVLNINSDASFSGSVKDTLSSNIDTFSGNASNNGNFTAVNNRGQTIQGNISLGGGTASGSFSNSNGTRGVFNVSQ